MLKEVIESTERTGDRSLSRRNSQEYNLKCYKIIDEAGH